MSSLYQHLISVYTCILKTGGTYDGKEKTLHRFAANFRKLSPNCQVCLQALRDRSSAPRLGCTRHCMIVLVAIDQTLMMCFLPRAGAAHG